MAPEGPQTPAQTSAADVDNTSKPVISDASPLLPLHVSTTGPPEYDNTKCSWLCCWEELK
eukprot:m.16903 g.16903  ORF g.16903 m.16903 type:complete len:60 (+) comp10624_c0_seq1:234-413(+)